MKPGANRTTSFMRFPILAVLIAVLAFSGCINFKANYIDPKFGEVANDVSRVREDGKAVAMPANAPSISQGFNPAPFEKEQKSNPQDHPGIDIVASRGTPILAAHDGIVVKSFFDPAFGHQVSIHHGKFTDDLEMKTNYIHLQEKWVKVGDSVTIGQQIGELGSSGIFAAFPHLHFEVRYLDNKGRWIPVNPHLYWLHGIGIVTCFTGNTEIPGDRFSITFPVQCRNDG